MRSPLAGWSKASRRACRNMRVEALAGSACRAPALVEREVAVLGVADDRVARVRQVHADLVRAAGLDGHVQQREAGTALHHLDQRDRAPAVASSAGRPARTRRSPSASRYLCSGTSMTFSLAGQAPTHQRRVGLAGVAARGTGPAAPSARCASWPAAARPRSPVQPVHQFQEPRLRAARWRSCSITPKLTPLPPCTATPAGLSMASRCSSSNSTGNSRAGAGGARPAARPGAPAARAPRRRAPAGCRPRPGPC